MSSFSPCKIQNTRTLSRFMGLFIHSQCTLMMLLMGLWFKYVRVYTQNFETRRERLPLQIYHKPLKLTPRVNWCEAMESINFDKIILTFFPIRKCNEMFLEVSANKTLFSISNTAHKYLCHNSGKSTTTKRKEKSMYSATKKKGAPMIWSLSEASCWPSQLQLSGLIDLGVLGSWVCCLYCLLGDFQCDNQANPGQPVSIYYVV